MAKWDGYPNLRARPHSPAAGKGRLQIAARRVFVATGQREISASVFYSWAYAGRKMRGEPVTAWYRYSMQRVLKTIADPVRRTKPYGAIIWRLREPLKKP